MPIPIFSAWPAEGHSRRARVSFYTQAVPLSPSLRRCSATLVLSMVLVAACNDTGEGASVSVDTLTATSSTTHHDDGSLVIGAILPHSGSAADLGSSMSDALAAGLAEINAAGGINGEPIRLLTAYEGTNLRPPNWPSRILRLAWMPSSGLPPRSTRWALFAALSRREC